MSSLPKVSYIIACYNAEEHLAETLRSLLSQTHRPSEIIVVNDGSKDGSLAVARSFEENGVIILDQPNRGQCAAENAGFRASSGDYVTFIDADDLMAPDKTERQIAALAELGFPPDVMATCEWARFYHAPTDAAFKPQSLWKDFYPLDWFVEAWSNHLMMHGATWLLPRKAVEASGLWNESLSLINDHEFFPRVMMQCRLIKFVTGARTFYRSAVENNLSGQKSRKARESEISALLLSTDFALSHEDSPRMRKACATKLQRFIYELYPEHPDLQAKAEAKVRALGGSDLMPSGGRFFEAARRVVGWKVAKRLQAKVYALGYYRYGQQKLREKARQKTSG